MYGTLLLIHILAATIWTGGHIVLSLVVLPKVLREGATRQLLDFESVYEKIGLPALVLQVVTGLALAHRLIPDVSQWFNLADPVSHGIALKLILLTLTVGFAIDAKLRIIPNLSERNLVVMAWHIIPVTCFSIMFVVVGVSFRTGWLW
ncbi:copper resistance protein CopD [Aliikangiella coralliicola]|uniref:Copper resistance protein CopD n=1 Tax=Aliikangiella coralliicola TaxID=2592383 RepID=A0A545UFQ6_9GAMM|nr:copper resistance protein CopD [Aliikangiella coralliicola]TQV88300.1 copper resistance protein CopD [Aliikangiella coralliicola]